MTDDWCSVCDCRFNPDKLTRKYPILSSSFSSTINESLSSTSQSSSSDEERKRSSTFRPLRSSLGHPTDYYTSKRIDQLHERMDDIQMFSFLKFVNYHLALKNSKFQINDIGKDLSNGHALIDLIEIFSSTKLKREHGQTRFHSLTNVRHVLDYLQTHTEHLNISPQDIVSGNRKQILALLWIIMKLFDFPSFRLTNKNCFRENTLLGCGQDRSVVLQWLNQILNQTLPGESMPVRDFYLQTWCNGYYFSLILKYLVPLSVKYITVPTFEFLRELDQLKPYDKQSFHICLNLCHHCFDTVTTIDYSDQTERSLFKYFTELQQNIFILLKSNQIGKLIQNNPYTKQILETVGQTGHVSDVSRNNEQYLICMEDNRGEQNKLPNNSRDHATLPEDSRTVERARTIQRRKQCETSSSDSHATNGRGEEHPEPVTAISQPIDSTAKKAVQATIPRSNETITSYQPLDAVADVEQPTIKDERTVTIVEKLTHEKAEKPSAEGREPHLLLTSKDAVKSDAPINAGRDSEQLTATANKGIEKTQSFAPSNHENEHVKLDLSVVIAQEPEQVTPVALPSTSRNEETEHTIVPNTDTLSSEMIEVEGSTFEKEKLEQPVQYNSEESEPLPLIGEEAELASIEWEGVEDHKSSREDERLQQSIALSEEKEDAANGSEQSSKELIEESKTEIKPSDQIIPTTAEKKHVPDKSESVIAKTDLDHRTINSTKVNNTSAVEGEELVRPSQNNYFGHTDGESKLDPPLKYTGSSQERTIIPVENNHLTAANEGRKHSITDRTLLPPVSDEEKKPHTVESMQVETSVTSPTKPEQSTVKEDKLNETTAPTKSVQQRAENKPSAHTNKLSEPSAVPKPSSDLAINTTSVVKNHYLVVNEDSEQSITEKPPQSSISNGKTTKISTENNSPIVKSIKEQRSATPRETPQSTITTNKQFHSSTTMNTKPNGTTKTSTQIAPLIEEKRYSTALNEHRQAIPEPLMHTASTITKGDKYSDIVTKQANKKNNGSAQATSALKPPEQCAASKKNVNSPLNEEYKQSFTSVDEAKPIPVTSAIKKSEDCRVALEKEGQPLVSVKKEASASAIVNEDNRQLSDRSKKSRRANAKKRKATNSSVKVTCPEQSISEHEEEIVELPDVPSGLTDVVEVGKSSQTQSEILVSSSNSETPLKNESSLKSNTSRSRKNKKRKTVATTTTTVIEKSSSSLASIGTTPSRNLFLVIQRFIHDPKSIAFKCIFILLCLCFSIILLVLSHK